MTNQAIAAARRPGAASSASHSTRPGHWQSQAAAELRGHRASDLADGGHSAARHGAAAVLALGSAPAGRPFSGGPGPAAARRPGRRPLSGFFNPAAAGQNPTASGTAQGTARRPRVQTRWAGTFGEAGGLARRGPPPLPASRSGAGPPGSRLVPGD